MVQLLAITLVDGLKSKVHVRLLRIANGNRGAKQFQQEPAI